MIGTFNSSVVFNKIHTLADVEQTTTPDDFRVLLSRPYKAPFIFTSIVLSVNLGVFFDGCMLLEIQVGDGKNWSPFFKLGLFSESFKQSFPDQINEWGVLRIDELILARAVRYYRFRVRMEGEVPLMSVGVCGVRDSFVYKEDKAARLPVGLFAMKVNPISQKEQLCPDKMRICSPTSLCMALNALGQHIGLSKILQNVYDQSFDIYGNWMFNTAYASEQGVDAYVRRFESLQELKKACTDHSLVVASIAYEKGELPGAAQAATSGHLVLVRGYQDGKILVADPAGETADKVLRAYEAKAFARAWLKNKKGAAYLLKKR